MKYILAFIIVLLIILIFISKCTCDIPKEHFEMDKTELMDSVHQVARTPTINITSKELDDTLITNFIKNDMESSDTSLIDYPEEEANVSQTSSLEESDIVKINQDHLIEKRINNQKIKLQNLLLELEKINKLETKLECN